MKSTRVRTILGTALAVIVATAAFGSQAVADEQESAMARGGQLYDKWYKVLDADEPKASHPLYPADKKYAEKPGANWRCKECHGWDYQGKDGAYSSGKHFSGIAGIRGKKDAAVSEIVAILKDGKHGYGNLMGEQDLRDVALFVSKGQIDMDRYIDRASKMPKGDKAKGAAYYNTICANCHGRDGTEPEEMKPFGDQMGNPWEVMHKILNGQPAEKMPALRALDRQVVVDVMAYMTTLPKKR